MRREQEAMRMKSWQQTQQLWNQLQGWRFWRSQHSHLRPQEDRQKNRKNADQGCPEWTESSPRPLMKSRGSRVLTGGVKSREELMVLEQQLIFSVSEQR